VQRLTSMADDRNARGWWVTTKASTILIFALFMVSGCGFPQSQGQSQNAQTFATIQRGNQVLTTVPGAFSSLDMISATVGWAVSWDLAGSGSYVILRTTDGGSHWRAALRCTSTQGEGRGFMESCWEDFRSATVATVVQPEYDAKTQISQIRIFHTADGGATWQNSVLAARDLETPATFIDALHGWALVTEDFPGRDPGSSYIGQEISLYRTSDGGQTWQRAAHGPANSQLGVTSDDAYGVAPLTANARITFSSLTTGWLVGSTFQRNGSSQNWLYITRDGGVTWRQTSLTFVANAFVPGSPIFFTPQDGVLPVEVAGSMVNTGMLYTTHDGGQTWSSTAVPFDITNGGFIDMEHAWTLATDVDVSASLTATAVSMTAPNPPTPNDSGDLTSLRITSDGWQHWTEVHLPAAPKRIYGFDFVSPTIGWALTDNRTKSFPAPGGGLSKGDVVTLLKTADGGATWQEIALSQV
jgi:photosystem II stability/assembly factor-like uncharacterized protein